MLQPRPANRFVQGIGDPTEGLIDHGLKFFAAQPEL